MKKPKAAYKEFKKLLITQQFDELEAMVQEWLASLDLEEAIDYSAIEIKNEYILRYNKYKYNTITLLKKLTEASERSKRTLNFSFGIMIMLSIFAIQSTKNERLMYLLLLNLTTPTALNLAAINKKINEDKNMINGRIAYLEKLITQDTIILPHQDITDGFILFTIKGKKAFQYIYTDIFGGNQAQKDNNEGPKDFTKTKAKSENKNPS